MAENMKPNKKKPNKKVQNGINWGAGATIVVTIIAVFFPESYERLPPGFEVALGTFIGSAIATGAAYMKRE